MIRHQVIIPLGAMVLFLVLLAWGPLTSLQVSQGVPCSCPQEIHGDQNLPDLTGIRDVHKRKVQFFQYLLPLVQRENQHLAELRLRLECIQLELRWGRDLSADDRRWLAEITREYRLEDSEVQDPRFWEELFLRVDQIPESLVLVQAANESAWGTSRFAREGNNLFGQWCFTLDCGMVPDVRPAGETHEVAKFESVAQSIAGYLRNLNTGFAYEDLRDIRAEIKRQGQTVTAEDLAPGLIRYSQRREDYVRDLLAMLKKNNPLIDEIRPPRSEKPEA